ncbi:TRAP transporter substrate-binding protein DctP [Desulfobacula sp.]|uniref:TRAP transporter substrate-binding protein n=1 Tax=Desulfobacula sp. TaxID=2593537 RepID=UPI0026297BF6|nr:TRAP transporter substrate-binding protein DctP [Desulfobacula sp.]
MKKCVLVFITILFTVVLIGGSSAVLAKDKKVTWKIQSSFPESDCDWYVTLKRYKEIVESASNGLVAFEIFPAGTLVEPDSIVDAVANGAIQGGHIIGGTAADRAPSCLGSEMPFAARNMKEHYEVHFDWGLMDIMREEYEKRNLFLLTVGNSGQIAFESTFPVNTLDDLKGKKIWAIPNALWLTRFGASPVEVPGMDMYSALKLGTIDGFTWTIGELEFGNFKEVVTSVMQPRLLTPGTHLLLNLKAWKKLSPEIQQNILTAFKEKQLSISEEYASYDEKAVKASKAYGVKFIELPPAEVARLKQASQGFWKEVEGMSPAAAKMVKRYKEFLKAKGIE